jgi:hypothetical protein
MDQCSDSAIFVVPFRDIKPALRAAGALKFGEGKGDLFGIAFIKLIGSEELALASASLRRQKANRNSWWAWCQSSAASRVGLSDACAAPVERVAWGTW